MAQRATQSRQQARIEEGALGRLNKKSGSMQRSERKYEQQCRVGDLGEKKTRTTEEKRAEAEMKRPAAAILNERGLVQAQKMGPPTDPPCVQLQTPRRTASGQDYPSPRLCCLQPIHSNFRGASLVSPLDSAAMRLPEGRCLFDCLIFASITGEISGLQKGDVSCPRKVLLCTELISSHANHGPRLSETVSWPLYDWWGHPPCPTFQ